MEKEFLNINANLVDDVKYVEMNDKDKILKICNFTLVKKYGKGKEYINCSIYGDKTELTKTFKKGDFIHVFGYFKETKKEDKTYKNFIVKHLNKIEKKENKEEE